MARCCGSTGTCACKMEAGRHISIAGSGTSGDPFVVASETMLAIENTETFDLGLSGAGTLAEPWVLTIRFADGSGLKNLLDVSDSAPTNGYVLGWNSSTQQWEPRPPTTASSGSVVTDTSLLGDGSSGSPLHVKIDAARFLSVNSAGLGLSDAGLNQIIRVFNDTTTRAAASPAPTVGAMSILNSNPGRLDYWDGSAWTPISNGIRVNAQPGQFASFSGPYNGSTALRQYIRQVSLTTASDGTFAAIPAGDLATVAGVLSVHVQETGSTPWKCMVTSGSFTVTGKAYRIDTGAALGSTPITAVVTALLY